MNHDMKRAALLVLTLWSAVAVCCWTWRTSGTQPADPQFLQQQSVSVRGPGGDGSGIIAHRVGRTFVWTAGHLFDAGVQAGDPATVQLADGSEHEARLLSWSEPFHGYDLAVLELIEPLTDRPGVRFAEEDADVGDSLWHIGLLGGTFGYHGPQSLTEGVVSHLHRETVGGFHYHQCSCEIQHGSSGGGVFLQRTGECVGLITQIHGDGFSLYVPVSHMHDWAQQVGLDWTIDPSRPVPLCHCEPVFQLASEIPPEPQP